MLNLELTSEEVGLLLDYMQNATINNINGYAMAALAHIMGKLVQHAVDMNSEEQENSGAQK